MILVIYTDEENQDVYVVALKTLEKQFLSESDPNLRFLGLQVIKEDLQDSQVQKFFAQKLMKMINEEREPSLMNQLLAIMQKIVNS
jgi:hypothetical protein